MPPVTKRQAQEAQAQERLQRSSRKPMMSDTDINYILINGAQIALSKMTRANSREDALYHHAQISAYLEVSLSRGAGITEDTRQDLNQIHQQATHLYMQSNRAN